MLELIVPQVIQLIMDDLKVSNIEAADLLYTSELYDMLEKEESKLWHFSAVTLFILFKTHEFNRVSTCPIGIYPTPNQCLTQAGTVSS